VIVAKDKTLIRFFGWGAVGAAATAAYIRIIRPWYLRWGVTDEEISRPLPEISWWATPNRFRRERFTILASAEEIWPWLVQLGQGRGGSEVDILGLMP